MKKYLCRRYYSNKLNGINKNCRDCRFHHPSEVSQKYTQEYNRELGFCYCGSVLKTIINRRSRRNNDDNSFFIIVCSRTHKGMKRCRV